MTAPSSSGRRKASTSRHIRHARKRAEAGSVNSLFTTFAREKAKWKERDEAWLKIENLAKSNPQVPALPTGLNQKNTPQSHPDWFIFSSRQFLMYHDSASPERPVDMETDGPPLDDVTLLKKTVQEEATEVRRSREERRRCCASRFFEFSLLSFRSRRSSVESAR